MATPKYDTTNNVNICNLIWVDDTTFSGKTGTSLRSNFGEDYLAFVHNYTYVNLDAAGYESATATINGTVRAEIRTSDHTNVDGGDNFTHEARKDTFHYGLDVNTDGPWYCWDNEYKNYNIKLEDWVI